MTTKNAGKTSTYYGQSHNLSPLLYISLLQPNIVVHESSNGVFLSPSPKLYGITPMKKFPLSYVQISPNFIRTFRRNIS